MSQQTKKNERTSVHPGKKYRSKPTGTTEPQEDLELETQATSENGNVDGLKRSMDKKPYNKQLEAHFPSHTLYT